MTITLNHFSAAAVFALFASIVFGITHRDTTRDMVRYGLYCFAMFLGGVIARRLGNVVVAKIADSSRLTPRAIRICSLHRLR